MKQLLTVLFTIILFANCNNNSGWSANDRQLGVKACMNEVGTKLDDATARKYCSCVIDKASQKYKNFAEANNGSEADGTRMGQECLKELKLGNNAGDDDTKGKKAGGLFGGLDDGAGKDNLHGDDENGGGEGWPSLDKNTFLTQCETGLTGQGYSSSKASGLCNCVLEKLEKNFRNLRDANERGKEAAGSRALQECLAGGNTDDN